MKNRNVNYFKLFKTEIFFDIINVLISLHFLLHFFCTCAMQDREHINIVT